MKKDAKISEGWEWNLSWSRSLRGREEASLNNLLHCLTGTKLNHQKKMFGAGAQQEMAFSR